ncbi:MAG TPA: aminotransferase class V-fold PLP-dependent enzyme [Acidimicrobiales bacterium]|jgi:L-seryl-tRNA(Ser) seleniumtransferase
MVRDIYAELGVRRVINAATTLTALGGTVLAEGVADAMLAASTSCVSIDELHAGASKRLAELTRNEDAYVTSGCAAAIALSVLACITKGDPALIARMPYDESLARNVVIHRAHRIPYDRAVELGGGHLVEIGNVIQTFPWEIEAAIDEQTVAVVWVAGSHLPQTTLSLGSTVEIAHARGVPVIVDAAAQLPPLENLWRFTNECGADLVLFSGGKALQGPQASGLIVGSRSLLDAVRANASPLQRLARAMKVGKEEICGLVAAVERYIALDHDATASSWEATVEVWRKSLSPLHGVEARRLALNEAGQPVVRLELTIDSGVAGVTARDIVDRLWSGDPRVAVLPGTDNRIFVTPDTLGAGEADIVLGRLHEALTSSRHNEKETSDVA